MLFLSQQERRRKHNKSRIIYVLDVALFFLLASRYFSQSSTIVCMLAMLIKLSACYSSRFMFLARNSRRRHEYSRFFLQKKWTERSWSLRHIVMDKSKSHLGKRVTTWSQRKWFRIWIIVRWISAVVTQNVAEDVQVRMHAIWSCWCDTRWNAVWRWNASACSHFAIQSQSCLLHGVVKMHGKIEFSLTEFFPFHSHSIIPANSISLQKLFTLLACTFRLRWGSKQTGWKNLFCVRKTKSKWKLRINKKII